MELSLRGLLWWTLTCVQYGTDLGGCMLSCCCHWCRCHYCSSWCYSPCDWHMHLANCQAATAGWEVPPCWEGQVCNKEHHRAVNQNLPLSSCVADEGAGGGCTGFGAGRHLPLVSPQCKCIYPVSLLYNTKGHKYHSPASTARWFSSLICHCKEKQKKIHSTLMGCQEEEVPKAEEVKPWKAFWERSQKYTLQYMPPSIGLRVWVCGLMCTNTM